MAKYGYRDITDCTFVDITTKQPVIHLDYLSTSSQSFGSEIVEARGSRGDPLLVSFQSGNSMDIEMNSPLLTPELLSLLFGSNIETGVKYVAVTEIVVTTTNTFNISATPYTGDLTNYPITCASTLDATVPTTHLTKVVSSTPTVTQFDVTARVVTVNSSTYSAGGSFMVTYYKATTASNKRVVLDSDKFSKTYEIHGYTLWKNVSDGLNYPCYIKMPKVQIITDGSVLNSASSGDPTSLVIKGNVLKPSGSVSMVIYDIDEGDSV